MIILFSTKNGWFKGEGFYKFAKPFLKIRYYKNRLVVNNRVIKTSKPLQIINKLIKGSYALGFIGYDFNFYTQKAVNPKKDELNIPLIYINLYKSFKKINLETFKIIDMKVKNLKFNTKREEFIEKIKKVKEYIQAGDIYQVNISHRIDLEGIFQPFEIFKNLVQIQPTPYMMFIKDKDFSLISGSMELFLEKNGNTITSKPIKGTRKRSKDETEDKQLKEELKLSEKEKAENLMITDLMRNDIGRISKLVSVESLFDIQEYNTLYQMISTVKGVLKEDISFKDIIINTFPPGSVTGAPKIRAMEIIDELEDKRRSVYCGSTFLIKPDGNFVMSVAIRQIIFKKQKAHIYVGSGIVWDSDEDKEYEETLIKSKASLKAFNINNLNSLKHS